MCKFNKSCLFINAINSFNGFQVSSWMKLLFNTLVFMGKKFLSFPRLKNPSLFSCQQTDYTQHLPQNWKTNMAICDQTWIGRQVFVLKGNLVTPLRQWYFPPDVGTGLATSLMECQRRGFPLFCTLCGDTYFLYIISYFHN